MGKSRWLSQHRHMFDDTSEGGHSFSTLPPPLQTQHVGLRCALWIPAIVIRHHEFQPNHDAMLSIFCALGRTVMERNNLNCCGFDLRLIAGRLYKLSLVHACRCLNYALSNNFVNSWAGRSHNMSHAPCLYARMRFHSCARSSHACMGSSVMLRDVLFLLDFATAHSSSKKPPCRYPCCTPSTPSTSPSWSCPTPKSCFSDNREWFHRVSSALSAHTLMSHPS